MIFELMIFVTTDILFRDYILSAFVTFVVAVVSIFIVWEELQCIVAARRQQGWHVKRLQDATSRPRLSLMTGS